MRKYKKQFILQNILKIKKQMLYSLIFILSSVFVFIGCSKIKSERIKPYKTKAYIEKPYTDPLEDKKALFLINKTKEFNSNIVSSKGIALVKIKDTNAEKKFKIAWATIFPDKIRLSFLVSTQMNMIYTLSKKKIRLWKNISVFRLRYRK